MGECAKGVGPNTQAGVRVAIQCEACALLVEAKNVAIILPSTRLMRSLVTCASVKRDAGS